MSLGMSVSPVERILGKVKSNGRKCQDGKKFEDEVCQYGKVGVCPTLLLDFPDFYPIFL
jgi:hypothetical protein